MLRTQYVQAIMPCGGRNRTSMSEPSSVSLQAYEPNRMTSNCSCGNKRCRPSRSWLIIENTSLCEDIDTPAFLSVDIIAHVVLFIQEPLRKVCCSQCRTTLHLGQKENKRAVNIQQSPHFLRLPTGNTGIFSRFSLVLAE